MNPLRARMALNLALLAGLGIALAAIIFMQARPPGGDTLIPDYDPAAVKAIHITRAGKPEVRLEVVDGGWRMTSPWDRPASPARMRALLRLGMTPVSRRYAAGEVDLSRYGLDPVLATVDLDGTRVTFGSLNEISHKRHVLGGGQMVLIDEPAFDPLLDDAAAYVSTRLLEPGAELAGIETPGYRLARDGNHWNVLSGRIEPEQAGEVASSWQEAGALWVGTTDTDGIAGDPVTLTLADGGKLSWIITSRDPELVLTDPVTGLAYHFSARQAQRLLARKPPAP